MTYHSVEKQHGVRHLNTNPDFEPEKPFIHISLKNLPNFETEIEWDVQACESFLQDQGRWLRLRPNETLPT